MSRMIETERTAFQVEKGRNVREEEGKEQRSRTVFRFQDMVMCVFLLLMLFSTFISGSYAVFAFVIPFFLLYCVCLYANEKIRAKWLMYGHTCLLIAFVVGFVLIFGWNCGAQHFIYVLIALVYTAGSGDKRERMAETLILALLWLCLFGYVRLYEPVVVVGETAEISFQMLSALAVIFSLFCSLSILTEGMESTEEELTALQKQRKLISEQDMLTGLWNRKTILEYMEKFSTGKNSGSATLAVAVGDVDLFAKINDRYGHDCGDIVLKQLAVQFRDYMKDKGAVARWSGEEFLFVFQNMAGEDAYFYLTQLQQKIRNCNFYWKDEQIKLTMSYGLMEYMPEKGIDYCISEADKKLYMGKESGRNTIIF